ncbi:SLC5 family protein [Bacteroides cellulosilyticus]|uniref:SLC5 family protein n=1 Tax=Bacteroides cellulosilyticus TaxID=246787 RepID=UPI001C37AED6|nr:sodium/solute symporter [Bacteroides cellulosilyticus]MBV3638551.1 sodium/solute symporter [Bacteroides cellulosilyticus]MBV3664288.1 sodium/solute symporter [Bacteroides cellulosilyticus]MBV3686189.1 sodium/solute symporter [Bacteroides cellulosilyticus]MBV3694770.1 sodium/solute symporter [Bacteroides cellulosilyticus]MBV3708486.1 sodium/solute symporter [Bacteroides cellulosilyticus]
MELHLLDFVSFFGYFVFLSFIGWYMGRAKKQAASDYFLAGKTLPWYVVGSSYIAANISTEHFLGMIGAAVLYGIVVATPEWSSVIAFSFLIWLFIPFLLGSKVYTTPEFLERRFNKEIRLLFALITLLANVTAFMAPVIYGGGLIVEEALGFNALFGLNADAVAAGYIPNWGLFLSIFLIAFASGVWAIWGGLKSVAWMDVLTIVIMLVGGLLVTFLGLSHLGGGNIAAGFSEMIGANQCSDGWGAAWLDENVPNMLAGASVGAGYNRLSVLQPINHATTPWTHWVFSFFYIGLWYTVINQHMIQKVFAAKNIYHARMGMVFASFLKLLLPFIVVVPGLIWFAMKPEFLFTGNWPLMSEEANKTYILMISRLVPPFMTGLLLAALFGAIQSTVSSVLNSTSTIFTLDFYKMYINRRATEQQEIRMGKMSGGLILTVSVLLAIMLAMTKINIFVYIQTLYTFIAPPFSAIFLVGMLWKRVNGRDALTAIIVSFALGALLKYLEYGPLAESHSAFAQFVKPFANQGLMVWAVAVLTAVISACFTSSPADEQVGEGLVFSFHNLTTLKEGLGRRWYSGVFFWWALSFVLMVLLIVYFSVVF